MSENTVSVLSKIEFNPLCAEFLGIEKEYFLTQPGLPGMPVPAARQFLEAMRPEDHRGRWTYELSACQAEDRTRPRRSVDSLITDLARGHAMGVRVAECLGCLLVPMEVGPEDMPVLVYPGDERYRGLQATQPPEIIRAACRVASVQIHYGCRDIHHAIEVHSRLVPHLDMLAAMGDHSGGERLRMYKQMARFWQPPIYESVAHFEAVALEQRFVHQPKNCWHLIRISRHGTVEVRVFGNTADLDEIRYWAETVQSLARG